MAHYAGQYRCDLCNVTVFSQQQLNQHCSGITHTTLMANFQQNPPSRAPPLRPIVVRQNIGNYFVPEGSLTEQNQQVMMPNNGTPPSADVSNGLVMYEGNNSTDMTGYGSTDWSQPPSSTNSCTNYPVHCSTCRITMTSQAQAQAHFLGNKHHQKVKLLEAEGGDANAQSKKNPDIYCTMCNTQFTSPIQAQAHYSGAKHRQKMKKLHGVDMTESNSLFITEHREGDTAQFCNSCRVTFTSQAQADYHYQGTKHKNRLLIIESVRKDQEMLGAGGRVGGVKSSKPKFLMMCEICNIKMSSPVAMAAHYNGSKHKRKAAYFTDLGNAEPVQPAPNSAVAYNSIEEDPDRFCKLCQLQFNSASMASAHYNGSKHKRKTCAAEENLSNQGEPAAKKAKLFTVCPTCNVSLGPLDQQAHFNSPEHQRRAAAVMKMSLEMEVEEGAAANAGNQDASSTTNTNNAADFQTMREDFVKQEDIVKQGGQFFCSFCKITVNSQQQMDAHRSGNKHKARVTRIANESKARTADNAPPPPPPPPPTTTTTTTIAGAFMATSTYHTNNNNPPPPSLMPQGQGHTTTMV